MRRTVATSRQVVRPRRRVISMNAPGNKSVAEMTRVELDTLASRFTRVYTGAISDILDGHGYDGQTLPPELRPLKTGTRLAGPAYTVEGKPHTGHKYDDSIRRILTMLGSTPPGYVAVYQTNASVGAHFGELSATSLQSRGCAGTIVDGGCRDINFILRQDYPVFARYTTPQDCVPRWECTRWGDVTIQVGHVTVSPADYVVADEDGIVVIPSTMLETVLGEAEERVSTENKIRSAVAEGVAPLEAYDRFGSF